MVNKRDREDDDDGAREQDLEGDNGRTTPSSGSEGMEDAGPMEPGESVLNLGKLAISAKADDGASTSSRPVASSSHLETLTSPKKIQIEYITDKNKRHISFSKRKAGILKKVSTLPCCRFLHSSIWSGYQAYELSTLTGTQVLLLVVSETGVVYSAYPDLRRTDDTQA